MAAALPLRTAPRIPDPDPGAPPARYPSECARPPVATPSAAVRRRPRALVHRWPLRAPALPGKIRRSELEAAELEAAGEERGRREAPWDRRCPHCPAEKSEVVISNLPLTSQISRVLEEKKNLAH